MHLEHENVSIFISRNHSVKPHEHDFLELAYVSRGEAEHIIGGKHMMIRKGNYFFVDYNTIHSYECPVGGIEVINCLFRPRFIDNSLVGCRSFDMLLNHYLIKVKADRLRIKPSNNIFYDEDGTVGDYMHTLVKEYNEKRPGFSEMMRCTLIELILCTMRGIAECGFQDDAIRFLADYAAENYADPLPLSELAHQLGYSLPYLSGRFKQATGVGFKDYLIRTRVDEACRLLANTDKKISDIASVVGYSDANFFYSTFRRVTGKSPGEFRRDIRQ